jgi:hypothetical protein
MKYLELYNLIIDNDEWLFADDEKGSYITAKIIGDTTYIICKETKGKYDWIKNLKFWKKPYRNMKETFFVHAGFSEDYSAVKDKLITWMYKYNPPKNAIVITGYSQGGAVAQLAYEDLWFHKLEVFECVAFASPRVFSFWNKKVLKKRMPNLVLIENGQDVVTRVPFKVMGYSHLVKAIHIGAKRTFLKFFTKSLWQDHFPDNYKKSLKEDQ